MFKLSVFRNQALCVYTLVVFKLSVFRLSVFRLSMFTGSIFYVVVLHGNQMNQRACVLLTLDYVFGTPAAQTDFQHTWQITANPS